MECLAYVTEALGELVAPHMHRLLGPLFSNGLSEQVGVLFFASSCFFVAGLCLCCACALVGTVMNGVENAGTV